MNKSIFLSVKQIAEKYNCDETKIYRLIWLYDNVKRVNTPKGMRVDFTDFDEWKKKRL